MVFVETVDGGKLKEAATKKVDESILIQIGIESIHVQYTSARLKEMYTVGLTLRNNLQRLLKNIVHLLGTRTGHHMHQILLVKTLVSPLLFNFMAWMLGFSDDPEDADYIELDDQTTSKIFLCVKNWSIFLIGGQYRYPSP
jgi:hypothetical protein